MAVRRNKNTAYFGAEIMMICIDAFFVFDPQYTLPLFQIIGMGSNSFL